MNVIAAAPPRIPPGGRFSPMITCIRATISASCVPPAVAICGWIFLGCLIAATFIDLDHFIIPDAFTVGLGVVGVLEAAAISLREKGRAVPVESNRGVLV
jgi:prepilin signal peptidase PulO-like enzyme (type II secretory pathway)